MRSFRFFCSFPPYPPRSQPSFGGSFRPRCNQTLTMPANTNIRKVVLAYSGGLDTSVILKWLQDVYRCDVVTFTADIGQGDEVEPARAKALQMGIQKSNIYIED